MIDYTQKVRELYNNPMTDLADDLTEALARHGLAVKEVE